MDCRYKWREPGQRMSALHLAVLLTGACLSLAFIVQWHGTMNAREGPGLQAGFGKNPRDPALPLGQTDQEISFENSDAFAAENAAGEGPLMPSRHPLSQEWGVPPAETWAMAGRPEQKDSLSNYSKMIGIALKMLQGRSKKEIIRELDTSDKKTLWNKYGNYFGSKEEAKKAYEEYKNKKASGQLDAGSRGRDP